MAEKVAGKLYGSITGQLFEIGRQLRQKNGYPFNPKTLHQYLQDAIEGRFGKVVNSEFLRLISGGETLIIDECDSSQVIANAKDIFAYIDSDFKNWGADEKGLATKRTPVQVYETKKDGTFSQLFRSLSFDLGKVCLSQDQILGFIRKYRDWLRVDGYGTFFLFQSKGYFFVADVYFYPDGKLRVLMNRLVNDFVWLVRNRHQVVVPRLRLA